MLSAKFLNLKALVLVGFVLCSSVLAVRALPTTASSLTWERDYETAVERAGAEEKLIIAYGFTDWCVICKRMDAETFVSPELTEEMASEYVWLKLNTETEEDGKRFQEEFAILTYPSILLLDSHGEEIERVSRFVAAAEFRETIESFIDSPDSLGNLRTAVEAQPDSVSARFALADKYLSQNNYVKAAAQFEKVIELDPENREGHTEESYYNVALSLASQERFEEALVQLDLLESRFPGSGNVGETAVLLRVQVLHCCGRMDEAEALLQQHRSANTEPVPIEEVENLFSTMETESTGN
jgi:tetratricopeptide (TPR) repeat protein